MRVRILLLTPGLGTGGGVGWLYQVGGILHEAGHDTRMVYNVANVRPGIETPVQSLWLNDLHREFADGRPMTCILPEFVIPEVSHNIPQHCELIYAVQNAHHMFHRIRPDQANPYEDKRIRQVWVVSEHSRRLISLLVPQLEASTRVFPIDAGAETFPPIPDKRNLVVWMPRKTELVELYARGLAAICERHGYELRALENMPRADVLKAMGEARVFVSTSRYEGMPMPILEAAYMGCALVGYSGTDRSPALFLDKTLMASEGPLDLFGQLDYVLKVAHNWTEASDLPRVQDYIRAHYNADALKAAVLEAVG